MVSLAVFPHPSPLFLLLFLQFAMLVFEERYSLRLQLLQGRSQLMAYLLHVFIFQISVLLVQIGNVFEPFLQKGFLSLGLLFFGLLLQVEPFEDFFKGVRIQVLRPELSLDLFEHLDLLLVVPHLHQIILYLSEVAQNLFPSQLV